MSSWEPWQRVTRAHASQPEKWGCETKLLLRVTSESRVWKRAWFFSPLSICYCWQGEVLCQRKEADTNSERKKCSEQFIYMPITFSNVVFARPSTHMWEQCLCSVIPALLVLLKPVYEQRGCFLDVLSHYQERDSSEQCSQKYILHVCASGMKLQKIQKYRMLSSG